MPARATRGLMAKTSLSDSSRKKNTPQLPALEANPVTTKTKPSTKKLTPKPTDGEAAAAAASAIPESLAKSAKPEEDADLEIKENDAGTPANVGKKRKRSAGVEIVPGSEGVSEEEMVNGYKDRPQSFDKVKTGRKGAVKNEQNTTVEPSPKKRAMKEVSVKKEEYTEKGDATTADQAHQAKSFATAKATPKRKQAKSDPTTPASEKVAKAPSKKDTYGVTEGVSPFPKYSRPTPEECYKVAAILRKAHPNCHPRPKTIPEPSQIVAGCGEVPSILDAMVRTLLSAATNGRNSSNAYQGMVARYGNRKSGVGKGSVDYNAVRLASQSDLEKAIASGGLAHNKSMNIKKILDMVYEENQQRRKDHLAAKTASENEVRPTGVVNETDEQKDAEIALAEENILSLDHLYYLPTYKAISHFTKYPGIGVKTAACVSLFCMQRDCFAVDTHVYRLCKLLGWVPDQTAPGYVRAKGEVTVDRDPTFSHLEVRIPDELKYDLHQLFIAHGKSCPRCKGGATEGGKNWEKGCPIEGLVQRREKSGSSAKKSMAKTAATRGKKSKKAAMDDDIDDEDGDDDLEMSDLVDDESDWSIEEALPDLDDEAEYKSPLKSQAKTPASSTRKTRSAEAKAASATPSKAASAKKATPAAKGRAKRVSAASVV